MQIHFQYSLSQVFLRTIGDYSFGRKDFLQEGNHWFKFEMWRRLPKRFTVLVVPMSMHPSLGRPGGRLHTTQAGTVLGTEGIEKDAMNS